MSVAGSIKQKIIDHLNTLQTGGTLKQVIIEKGGAQNMFDRDLLSFPVAILLPGTAEGGTETNQQNLYTYSFDIAVVMKSENIDSQTAVEDLLEAIVQEFNNDFTLGGTAEGSVDPTSSSPAAVESSGQTYTVFVVTIKAKALLTFNIQS